MARWGGRKSPEFRARVFATWGTVCWLCGGDGADTADHVIPRSKGGDNSTENGRPAHRSCNSRKGDRLMPRLGPPSPPTRRGIL